MQKRGQVSVEYMLIIGFVTLITIPLIIIYQSFTQDSSDEIVAAQVNQVAQHIVESAEQVYYLGEPSQTTLKVTMPEQVTASNVTSNGIIFTIRTKKGRADIVRSSIVNMTGSLPTKPGIYTITLRASQNSVAVSFK